MSKIRAVRFINLNYNHNSIRVSDETLYFNGESTLIKLDNGGGKSVLVQMMTAPFVQKRFRNTKDRPFAGYFTSSRPTFILVEWELEMQAGFLLTGMMVRQNQKPEEGNEDELEMINLISEYREPCLLDLQHLPVVEKTKDAVRIKSFSECRNLFDTYRRDRSVRFFSYDMNNTAQSRQYFEKLQEYGIHYREWQNIIRKVNEEESGLSKLFADCRDERGLVEKWFLETIESKLNRGRNRMQEFRSILEKYMTGYRSNKDKIRRRDVILRFEEEAAGIQEQAETYRNCAEQSAEKRKELAAWLHVLQSMQENAEADLENERICIEELREAIRKTDHQKHSAEYYAVRDQISALQTEREEQAARLAQADAQLSEQERALHLLETADRQAQADEAREEYERAVQALDVCRHRGEDLKPEREYIGWLLRVYYEKELALLREKREETNGKLCEKEAAMQAAGAAVAERELEARTLAQEIGRLKASVRAYDQEEDRYISHWKEELNRNLMGEYEPGLLAVMAEQLEKELSETVRDRAANRRSAEEAELAVRKREEELVRLDKAWQEAREKRTRAEERRDEFEEELRFRRTVLQYLELKEEVLFDTERILRTAGARTAELEAQISKMTLDARDLEEEIHTLTTGRTVALTPELESFLESLGIPVVYGMEWLKRNGLTEEANRLLVERHPFLPYALLMTEKESERLLRAELPVYTSAPIPVVTRESLADGRTTERRDSAAAAGVQFYMLFNRDLLNEEKLGALLAGKQRELEHRREEIRNRRNEHREYLDRRAKVAEQKITKAAYEDILQKIPALEASLETNRQDHARTKEQLAAARETVRQREEEFIELCRKHEGKTRQKGELEELTKAYEQYRRYLAELEKAGEKLAALDAGKKRLQEQIRHIGEEIRLLEVKQGELERKEEETEKNSRSFGWYMETEAPAGFEERLREDIAALAARYRAVTETVSLEEKELEETRKKAAGRLDRAEKEVDRRAKKYGFTEEDWKDIRFSAAEQDHAEEQIRILRGKKQDITAGKHELEVKLGRTEEAAKQTLEWMERDCGVRVPLDRENIPVIRYAEQKNILVQQKKDHETAAGNLQERVTVYSTNRTALSEYQDETSPEEISFREDFTLFTEEDFRMFTGKLQRAYRTAVETMAAERNRLEKLLQQTIRMEEFREEYYRKPLETILSLTGDAEQVLRQMAVVLQSYRDLMAKLMVDIAVIEQERSHIAAVLREYAAEIHVQMGKIDRNSSVPVRGKSLKLLKIDLPSWEENDAVYRRRVEDLIDDLTQKGIALMDKGESAHEFIGKRMTTRELYDAVVGIANVHIRLYKIEAQRELQITWNDVASNSGGEGFLSAFIILTSLLYYMRRDDTDIFADRNEGKVLLMDNPFAQTNAAHLLKPMMEMARKNNTQLICLTGLGGESIYNRFDNIYVLNLVESTLNRAQYLRGKHLSGSEPEVMSVSRLAVGDEFEQMELLF